MARDYGRVRAGFWDDPDIKECSPPAKMMALYLLTSQHTNAIGLFRLPVAYMQDDTGLTKEEIERAFFELHRIGFVEWCERVPWVWIRNYLKHNPPENANVWRKCLKELQSVPAQCLISVEVVAENLSAISLEPRMRKGQNAITEVEVTVLDGYRNRIERVVGAENNHAAGLRPLSYPVPCPLPEPIPKPLPNQSSAPPSAAPLTKPPIPKPAPQPKGRRWDPDEAIPPNWILEGEKSRVDHNLPVVDLILEAHKFANYWSSKTGKGATHADWKRTWLNWALNAKGHTNGRDKNTATDNHLAGIGLLVSESRARNLANRDEDSSGEG